MRMWLLAGRWRSPVRPAHRRSEEHTSELQSRLHLVCRLLLEKKKICNQALRVVAPTLASIEPLFLLIQLSEELAHASDDDIRPITLVSSTLSAYSHVFHILY